MDQPALYEDLIGQCNKEFLLANFSDNFTHWFTENSLSLIGQLPQSLKFSTLVWGTQYRLTILNYINFLACVMWLLKMADTTFFLAFLFSFILAVYSIPIIDKSKLDNLKIVSVTVDKKTGVYDFHEGYYTGENVAHAEYSDMRNDYG